jgi:hypothetical protein
MRSCCPEPGPVTVLRSGWELVLGREPIVHGDGYRPGQFAQEVRWLVVRIQVAQDPTATMEVDDHGCVSLLIQRLVDPDWDGAQGPLDLDVGHLAKLNGQLIITSTHLASLLLDFSMVVIGFRMSAPAPSILLCISRIRGSTALRCAPLLGMIVEHRSFI